jgi:hypothetical protein
MFDWYSIRAKQVIFLARLESGVRGAEMLNLGDLLAGLIIEDQNSIPSGLARLGMTGQLMILAEHQPFLPSDTATSVLEGIQGSLPRAQPISNSTDMPISPDLGETLATSTDLGKSLQSNEVTPLQLLAVMMRGSHRGVQALRDVGITEEEVLNAIRKGDEG